MANQMQQRLIADTVASMPSHSVEAFYSGRTLVDDELLGQVFDAGQALVKSSNLLVWKKMEGLAALDDYNEIELHHGEAMFLLGFEYGRRLAESRDATVVAESQ